MGASRASIVPAEPRAAEDVRRHEILRAVEAELEGGPRTGLQPYTREETLYLTQRDMSLVGRKRPRAQLSLPSGPSSVSPPTAPVSSSSTAMATW